MTTVWTSWGCSLNYDTTTAAGYTSLVSGFQVRTDHGWSWTRESVPKPAVLVSATAPYNYNWSTSFWPDIGNTEAVPAKILAQGFFGHAYRGSASPFVGDWQNNVRFWVKQVCSAAYLQTPFQGILLPNEPDADGSEFQNDMAKPGTDPTVIAGTTYLTRLGTLAREVYEECYTSAKYLTSPYPGFIAGPVFACGTFSTAAPGRYTLSQLADYNDGTGAGCLGNYFQVFTQHNHTDQSRFETFARAAPATGGYSLYWAWRCCKQLASNLGINPKWPLMNDETGINVDGNDGDWVAHKHEMRAMSYGVMVMSQFWYAVSLHIFWITMGSSQADMHTIDGSTGTNLWFQPEYQALVRYHSWKHNQMTSLPKVGTNTYLIPIKYKVWHGGSLRAGAIYANLWHLGYGDPRTWIVWMNQSIDPLIANGTDYPNVPWSYWQRVVFRDGEIRLAAHASERNLVGFPVILPSFVNTYTVTASCQVTGDATGSVIFGARGYNNVNGLIDAAVTAAAATTTGNVDWKQLNFTFQPVAHDIRHPISNAVLDFPDPCRCIVYYDHNGKGTAHIKNARIRQN